MDALIKSLRPGKPSDGKPSDTKPSDLKSSDVKPSEAKLAEPRSAELDPSDFLAVAVRGDQARPSRSEAEHAVELLRSYVGDSRGSEGLLDTPRGLVEACDALGQGYHQCRAEVLDGTFW